MNLYNKLTNYLLLFVVMSMPFHVFSIFLSDLFVTLSALIVIFFVIKNVNNINIIFQDNLVKFLLLFWIYISINSLFAIEAVESFKSSFLYIRFILFSIAFYFLIENKKNFLNIFSYVFVFIYLLNIINTYIQYFYEFDLLGNPKQEVRLSGFFGDELVIGSYLSKFTPLFIICVHFIKKEKYLIPILLFTLIIIYFSGERVSFFLFFLCYFFFVCFYIKNYLKILLIISFTFFIIFFLIASNKTTALRMINQPICSANLKIEKINSFFSCKIYDDQNNKNSFYISEAHQEHITSAYKIFKKKPLFGSGNKMFRYECKSKDVYMNHMSCTTHPHNLFFQIISELGVVGMIFLIIVIFHIYKNLFIIFKKDKNLNNIVIFMCLISFVQIFFIFLPSGQFFNNWNSIIHFTTLGFYIAYRKRKV